MFICSNQQGVVDILDYKNIKKGSGLKMVNIPSWFSDRYLSISDSTVLLSFECNFQYKITLVSCPDQITQAG